MATTAVHWTVNSSYTKRPIFFSSPFRQIPTQHFLPLRQVSSQMPAGFSQTHHHQQQKEKEQKLSLSEQHQPLSTTTLSDPPPKTNPS
ncbi:hypothetical protein PS1_002508 [Malus domestica]